MKIKIKLYFFLFTALILASSCASRKFTYFQTQEERKGRVVDIPSLRNKNVVRFQPDDILGITVNVPGEPGVASDYNLPLVPAATTENSSGEINQGVGRQTFLIRKDGTIDFPVLGVIKVSGYTQQELEEYLKQLLSEKLIAQSVVTVRLLNFTIWLTGEVLANGQYSVPKDNINLLQALSLGGGMSSYGRRDDVRIYRPTPDGGYTMASVDMSREDVIQNPYFYLHQNDIVYVLPSRSKTQQTDISPRYGFIVGVASLAFTIYLVAKSIK